MVRQIDVGPTGGGAAVTLLSGMVKGYAEAREKELERKQKEKEEATRIANELFSRKVRTKELELSEKRTADQMANSTLNRGKTKADLLWKAKEKLEAREGELAMMSFSKGLKEIYAGAQTENEAYLGGTELINQITDSAGVLAPGTVEKMQGALKESVKFAGKPKKNMEFRTDKNSLTGKVRLLSINKDNPGDVQITELPQDSPIESEFLHKRVSAALEDYKEAREAKLSVFLRMRNVNSMEIFMTQNLDTLNTEARQREFIRRTNEVDEYFREQMPDRRTFVRDIISSNTKSFKIKPESVDSVTDHFMANYPDVVLKSKDVEYKARVNKMIKQTQDFLKTPEGAVVTPEIARSIIAQVNSNTMPGIYKNLILEKIEKLIGRSLTDLANEDTQ